MKKALVVATIVDFIAGFEINDVKILRNLGYEVHYAANCDMFINEEKVRCLNSVGVIRHNIAFQRNPFNKNNFNAYKQLSSLINKEKFNVIHCHTPVGGILTRLAARKLRRKNTKIIYTTHGFHFYKGAPLKNWLLYYPIEKICSYFTDVLITINKEDYTLAQKKMKAKKVVYVPGVGIDLKKFADISVDKEAKRKELGIPTDSILLLSVGELNENKNHETVIKALSMINDPQIFYVIAGSGNKKEHLENAISELNLENNVHLVGYRNDINELLAASDIFVFPSYREGLSVALMEAMACGLPCVVSEIRGNTDLIENGVNGYLCSATDHGSFSSVIGKLADNSVLRRKMGKNNLRKIRNFELNKVKNQIKKIYECLD